MRSPPPLPAEADIGSASAFLDLNAEFPEGTTSLRATSFSPDGKYFAYALSVAGSDWCTIKVRDTTTGADLPDRVRWVKFSGINWLADSSGFLYSRFAAPAGVAPPNVEGTANEGGAIVESAAAAPPEGSSAGTETASVKGHMVWYHPLQSEQGADKEVFRYTENPDSTVGGGVTSDGRYLIINVNSGCDPVSRVFTCDLQLHASEWQAFLTQEATGSDATPVPILKLIDNFDAEYDIIANDGPTMWAKTNKNAPRYRIVAFTMPTSLEEEAAVTGDVADAGGDGAAGHLQLHEWLPQDPEGGVLDDASVLSSTYLITVLSRHAADVMHVRNLYAPDAPGAEVVMPGPGSLGVSGKRSQDRVMIKYVSYLAPGTSLRLDLPAVGNPWTREAPYTGEGLDVAQRGALPAYVGGAPTEIKEEHLKVSTWNTTVVPGFDASQFVAEQRFVAAADGVRIPYTIVRSKAAADADTPLPTLMYAYGGFNISMTPSFSATRLVWLSELGGAWVLANIRGGGEYGEEWHKGGALMQKTNCFDDFATVGRALMEQGVTAPGRLAIQGGSNGGLLTLAASLRNPDLYRAAVSQVPVADMLRFHMFTIGHAWKTDFGCAEDSAEWLEYLLGYSPVHNVTAPASPEQQLPAILVSTADHDDRVVPGPHSFKMVAALQSIAGPSPHQTHPLLLRVDRKAGHGAGKPTSKVLDEVAETFAFLAKELGMTFTKA